jgi:hypothetical protein
MNYGNNPNNMGKELIPLVVPFFLIPSKNTDGDNI